MSICSVEAYSSEYLMRYYCGFAPGYVSADMVDAVKIVEMPIYPDSGSIQVIDGIVVVRLE
ncbi:MAG: hypothetical protein K2O91_10990 [Lachnospiraceae bacterium]|nr:hypothetical protein [Lachnospiraceae bacterium]